MSTSYTNPLGSGYRADSIVITHSGILTGSDFIVINGNLFDTGAYLSGGAASGAYLTFDFGGPYVIDEAKWHQDNASTHGTWKWQGSPDNSAWTDIGSSFTLGGFTIQTITALSGNASSYRYYRLLGVSGTTSSSPWWREIEFKISLLDVLMLECAGAATLSSAYFVVFLSQTDIPTGDLPPLKDFRLTGTGGITELDGGISNWMTATPAHPTPVNGVWNAATTYALGDTVSSSHYSILTSASVILAPLTYRSLQGGNIGHDPDSFEGWWTCTTPPPHNLVIDKNFVPVSFGYALSPLPDAAAIAATVWKGKFWHSLSWSVTPPGDITQLMDMYVKMNYLVGGSIVPVVSRPQTAAATTTSPGAAIIYNPGINAQFQTWFTGGLVTFAELTLSNFQPPPIDGVEAAGVTGEAYISSIVASGGTPPYAYGLVAGSLPPGVTLNGTTGVISGTPTASGIFTFVAQVTDATGATAQVTCAAPIDCGGGGGEPTGAARNYLYHG